MFAVWCYTWISEGFQRHPWACTATWTSLSCLGVPEMQSRKITSLAGVWGWITTQNSHLKSSILLLPHLFEHSSGGDNTETQPWQWGFLPLHPPRAPGPRGGSKPPPDRHSVVKGVPWDLHQHPNSPPCTPLDLPSCYVWISAWLLFECAVSSLSLANMRCW